MGFGDLAELANQVRLLEARDFWFRTGLAGVAGALGFWRSFRALHRARLIENTPTAKARSAPQGYIELQGRGAMLDGEPTSAPLTDLPCTWWSFRVEKKTTYTDGKRRRTRWTTIESDTSDSLFLIEDATGRCVIDPEGAEVLPSQTDTWYGSEPRPAGPRSGWASSIGGRYRYTERRMHAGDPLLAIGFMRTHERIETTSTSDETRALLVEWKSNQDELLRRFDENCDRVLGTREWEKVRAAAELEVRRERNTQPAQTGVHVLSAAPDGRPFLLAASDQEQLIKRFRRRSVVSIVVFFASVIGCAFLIASRFSMPL